MKRKSSRPSQRDRLLNLLRSRGSQGVYVYEIIAPQPKGLGIAQYNTRIKELRDGISGEKYNIVNTESGHFVLMENRVEKTVVTRTNTTVEAEGKLEKLSNEIAELEQQLENETDKEKRLQIEGNLRVVRMRARALEIGLQKRDLQGEVKQVLVQGELV